MNRHTPPRETKPRPADVEPWVICEVQAFLTLSLEDGPAEARRNMRLAGKALNQADKARVWDGLPTEVKRQLWAAYSRTTEGRNLNIA